MKLVRLTRKVRFSSGHRYWDDGVSANENRARFGPFASPYNHGHNYILEATVEGPVQTATGMVVNIKLIDDVLQARVVGRFDGRSINDEIPEFAVQPPSIENLLRYFWEDLVGNLPAGATLTDLRLEEHSLLWGNLSAHDSMLTLTRSYEFAASHRLHCPDLSDSENVALFGKCNNRYGHGHNYKLEVTVTGTPDPVTSFIVDLGELDAVVESEIVDRYDHKCLNEDLEEFKNVNPTTEVVALRVFEVLEKALPVELVSVKIHETERSSFEVRR